MTEPNPAPLVLEMVGDTAAEVCEGEFCVIPPHHDQHVMNRRVDSDNI
ncbi:MAG: hypothetical protein ABIR17_04685 [Pseudolysinimonas sp.]